MSSGTSLSLPRLSEARQQAARSRIRATICEETAHVCTEYYGRNLLGIVLTGSLAREEATLIEGRKWWVLLGDAEFVLVFKQDVALPPDREVELAGRKVERALFERDIHGHIVLSAVRPSYLRKLRPHIFAYELRTCGQIVWGEPQLLSQIPAFAPRDIPPEDAWRLLANRIAEELEVADQLTNQPEILPRAVQYRTVKLYLDMATSLLVFAGEYAPTYRKRQQRLRALAGSAREGWPFPLDDFADRVAECTDWKLEDGSSRAGWDFWETAVWHAQRLWGWELSRLIGGRASEVSDGDLFGHWMKLQPLVRRLRGWLYVVRERSWHRSWREWPRWAGQAWSGSPRYWIYRAAAELFFRLPVLLRQQEQPQGVNSHWEQLRGFLPTRVPEVKGTASGWQGLAWAIGWNYQKFVVNTRA